MDSFDPLDKFLAPVPQWFRRALGEPTPAQREGWKAILARQHTLILAPTGSGKTLAAFLACLDELWRQDPLPRGTRVLYISPLKALNNDIRRNLEEPLAGVAETARQMGHSLPAIEVGLRSGDTASAERQRLIRKPPHILITTPESLHLLLTSRARETLRNLTHCIVDEIHALCPNKRGVFLSLLLERLEALNPQGFVRIGLSATQRPLSEVARFLGGSKFDASGNLSPRPVTIVDAGLRKDLDVKVVCPVKEFGPLPEKSIWPSIYRLLDSYIREHRSTIVFANGRRVVERITANLNEEETLAHAHHGSVSLEVRQETEQALKEGRLPAVVATASLELGIDMGAVDLVCQVESPGSVARGLQRVGRAGHLVGSRSKGRLIAKSPADLLEQAVLAREMAAGRVEELRTPTNCLDVLAQQIVSMVAMDSWQVPELYELVREAYPFRDLTPEVFDAVLEMMTGRYQFQASAALPVAGGQGLAALQPRISWDCVHNRLLPLPATRAFALTNGGTIPDTGQYAAYASNGTRIGELDEEFIYERRVGDVFLLGTNAWRLEKIESDRVRVSPAEGAPAMVPFWRGERVGRSFDLGIAMGRFLRELAGRLDQPDCLDWLEKEYFVDAGAAQNLKTYVRRQLEHARSLPTDKTIVVEAWRDPLGDWHLALLSPFGSRLHYALRLALEASLGQRLGYRPQCMHHDNGILFRLAATGEPPLDLLDGLTAENVEPLILEELAESALFAMRFRQNAARALLLPRVRPGKRAPLWLQRLRGRDLLQVARRQPDFPIVAETFRECLHDHLDVPRLRQLLEEIANGQIKLMASQTSTPSPFASGLLFAFTMAFMYQYDGTEAEPSRFPNLDTQLLQQLVAPEGKGRLLDQRAMQQVERRLQGLDYLPRSTAEMAERLRRLGDLTPSEILGPMAAFLKELEADGQARIIRIAACREPKRWILAEEEEHYQQAFGSAKINSAGVNRARSMILKRYLQTHASVNLRSLLDRYPFDRDWTHRQLEDWVQNGQAIAFSTPDTPEVVRWAAPFNLEQVQRRTLANLRSEVTPCSAAQFSTFVLRWQHIRRIEQPGAALELSDVLRQLEGLPLPVELWEQFVLPSRLPAYQPCHLDEVNGAGDWTWVCQGNGDDLLAFVNRENLSRFPCPAAKGDDRLDNTTVQVQECLKARGALFVTDLAQETRLAPSAVRAALWTLLRMGLVSNDQFDVIRKGDRNGQAAFEEQPPKFGSRFPPVKFHRQSGQCSEGRWSLIRWGHDVPEAHALQASVMLLRRYGIVCRELAALDPWMAPWSVLYQVLSKMEMAGEIRRGYFVEGLSGAQFALPEAARRLQDVEPAVNSGGPVLLLHSQDPANLYGSGAPFDVPILNGSSRPFLRRAGNWLAVRAGGPILLVEQQGKRLTPLAAASQSDLVEAVACLSTLLQKDRSSVSRHKLTVEEWDNRPVTATPGAELLEAVGFVRDYQSMTLYAAPR